MKLFQAEMHCHTMEVSLCSRIPAKYLAEGYAAAGYRYMFVTDHFHPATFANMGGKNWAEKVNEYLSGYTLAKAYAPVGLHVMPAMEVTLHYESADQMDTDFLVFGADREFLMNHPKLCDMDYEPFYKLMHENEFLVFQAHPYRYGLSPILPVCYDGVEAVNTHPRVFSYNKKAIQFAAKHGLYTIGGSDTHAEEDIGRGGVMLPTGIDEPMDFVQYVKENGSPELIVTYGA